MTKKLQKILATKRHVLMATKRELATNFNIPARDIIAMGEKKPSADDLTFARRLFARTVETPGGLKIQTIHAFCEKLLHLFPFEANVPAGFRVLDDISRAELIEPDALISCLNRGRPGMAAVDVFESEPILQGHPLLRLENCICTPHIGYVEQAGYEGQFTSSFGQIIAFLEGKPVNVINPEALTNLRK